MISSRERVVGRQRKDIVQGGSMRKRLAAVAIALAGIWLATTATAAAQNRGEGSGHAETHSSAAKPLGPMSPASSLQQNSKLADKLAAFFPLGTDITAEAAGFKNLGQFVSLVHVSHNLGIPFDNLKCTELGTVKATESSAVCPSSVTNENPESLGVAIHTLKPGTNPERAIQEADRQGEQDLNDGKPEGKS
jgi:hypothetical protein